MSTIATITHEQVRRILVARYPEFPVSVDESPDDPRVWCLRVFAVPEDKVREIKNFVGQIESELFPDGEYVLLAMVKNLQVTRQHYPEHLPPGEEGDRFRAIFSSLLRQKTSEWQIVEGNYTAQQNGAGFAHRNGASLEGGAPF